MHTVLFVRRIDFSQEISEERRSPHPCQEQVSPIKGSVPSISQRLLYHIKQAILDGKTTKWYNI
jgi:hypothetical protein